MLEGSSRGIWRYEHGTRVSEFTDLRANPRCVLEGQALEMRRRISELKLAEHLVCTSKESYAHRNDAYVGGSLTFDPHEREFWHDHWIVWGHHKFCSLMSIVLCKVFGSTFLLSKRQMGPSVTKGDSECMLGVNDAKKHASTSSHRGMAFLAEFHSRSLSTSQSSSQDFRSCLENFLEEMHSEGCLHISIESSLGSNDEELTPSPQQLKNTEMTCSKLANVNEIDQRQIEKDLEATNETSYAGRITSETFADLKIPCGPNEEDHGGQFRRLQTDDSRWLLMDESTNNSSMQLDAAQQLVGLELYGEEDDDYWHFYGAMLEEHVRLSGVVERATKQDTVE